MRMMLRIVAALTVLTIYYSFEFSFLRIPRSAHFQTLKPQSKDLPSSPTPFQEEDFETQEETLVPNNDALSEYNLLFRVHSTPKAAMAAGQWIERPAQAIHYTKEHLQCLDMERQGNCHDPDAWKSSDDKAKQSRHRAILNNAVANSPGIMNASDPWIWESILSAYSVVPYDDPVVYKNRIRRLLTNRTIYLVGDSVTRQWAQVLRCELVHLLGFSTEQAEQTIQRKADFEGEGLDELHATFLQNAQPHDYLVVNYGHHVGRAVKGTHWGAPYSKLMSRLQTINYGQLKDNHIFVRTTEVRHYLRGAGDWNTNSSQAGAFQPNMHAKWTMYGGNTPEQPMQNKLVLRILASEKRRRNYQILDTAPMMLARADASFDGTHFCLPGPHQFWSQMLYYRIEQNDGKEIR